ncbi:magnesium/cobalt transporter CorA [Arthrobacter sp. zg-Y40]|uniref:magnesium/cobalt transporter CorA n=1 Tax=unclassified Arthrobacter TaxID=235627 RepID=UPI001D151650|nr:MULTISPECIES: magnesium/cobalt transporter CorA [unclassified Arthrobacter]MCC3275290.1 magnesium/cobalt transporter CorA [Arthrobacter sp. zg-Y20]MCC3278365.1 magnesium/cobalt transporter CorA [Arthrobacter sp. zg-Y40]MDK1315448.1 magnesium/cobalt transporter CorA [Arthrobacter sp. zg.Y20]MDK1326557.1 magnesium/cobalt transporter CorA [Arthrobacter sp. zg-Y1143]WIB05865.1 magnesium/cobalt transporter CorA [Arthrobacter sp. zg-Y20]
MTLIDNAVYVDGKRVHDPDNLDETFELTRTSDGMAWIGLYRPDEVELLAVAEEFGLNLLIVEDALAGHQRSKLEQYNDQLFVVLRPARYLDDVERVEFGELHLFVGPNFVVTVRHAESPDLARVRKRVEQEPDLLALGPQAVLYAVLDQVVDEYAPVAAGLENDIDEIEDQLFSGDAEVSRRIYELSREVIQFQRAISPLQTVVGELRHAADQYGVPPELRDNLGDVLDHVLRLIDRANAYRAILENALTLSSTLASNRLAETSIEQNEQVKRISSWAAILFAPTLVGTVYGMNFDNMPELSWQFGYPLALLGMLVTGIVLYLTFKRNKWL